RFSPVERDLYKLGICLFSLAAGRLPSSRSVQPGQAFLLPPAPSLPMRLDKVLRTAVDGGFHSATQMSRALLDLDKDGRVAQAAFSR
ncbi:MAG: hypothetical protein AAFV53_36415, partial [Myxococcota bacterium]